MKTQRKNYTLVEMITVIAIVTILVTVGVPAFSKIMMGDQLNYATSTVKGIFEQAQSKALTNKKFVAAVIDLEDLQKRGAQSIRLCFVNTDGSNNFTFDRWVPDSEWRPLAAGVVIDKIGVITNSSSNTYQQNMDALAGKSLTAPQKTKIKLANGALTATNYPAIVFTKYGGLVDISGVVMLRFAEGVRSGGNFIYTNQSGGKPTNILALKINQFTAQPQYLR